MKDLITKVIIPTVIFRTPIHTNKIYDIQGMLLALCKYRESPDLSDWEKNRLKQLAATQKWIESGGEIKDGLWRKDGQCCAPETFIEANYHGQKVALVPVEYDRYAAGCIGIFCDILGEPNIGEQIREWVEQNSEWMTIEDFVSTKVDVQNEHFDISVPLNNVSHIFTYY